MNLQLILDSIDYTKPIEAISDKLSFGGMMVGLGMLSVFSVLLIIMISLYLFKSVFKSSGNNSNKTQKPKKTEPAPVVAPAPKQDDEIVAVLAAAIAMAESESNGIKFRVFSFKKR